jgi:hypothetical protein
VARAGVGGGVPHERAKHDSTRAKAQNAEVSDRAGDGARS